MAPERFLVLVVGGFVFLTLLGSLMYLIRLGVQHGFGEFWW